MVAKNFKGKICLHLQYHLYQLPIRLYLPVEYNFCDVDPLTANLSINEIKNLYKKIKINSISPVHFGGLPCDMKSLYKLNKSIKATIYEDAAHAFGAKYAEKNRVGSCKYST